MARPKTKPGEEWLSPAEWEMMQICWKLGRANVRDILREDLKKRTCDYKFATTLEVEPPFNNLFTCGIKMGPLGNNPQSVPTQLGHNT